jgi:CheY-like chemotaxis protein
MKDSGQRILIVDDDHLMRFGLSRALSQRSFEVTTAASARQALRGLDGSQPDLCLINFHLPDGDGLDLMEEIRNRCPDAKIVLMTASSISDLTVREHVNAAIAAGKCLFLAKPFNLTEATDLIFKALAGGQVRAGRQPPGDNYLNGRKFDRIPFVQVLDISTSVIKEGEVKRMSCRAVLTDLCDDGIGLLVHCPLHADQVISFGEELSGRTGMVIWSIMLDNQLCRAGIKFT